MPGRVPVPPPLPPFPLAVDPPIPVRIAAAICHLEGRIGDRIGLLHEELALMRGLLADGPAVELSAAESPASSRGRVLAARLWRGLLRGCNWLLMACGALGVTAQLASVYRPGVGSPLLALVQLVRGTP